MRYTFLFLILCQIMAGTATSFVDFRPNHTNAPLWQSPSPLPKKEISSVKVGLLIPLSGQNKDIGQSILDAALLGLYKFPNTDITLVPIDSGTTEQDAFVAANHTLDKGCDLILGPVFSRQVAAVKKQIPKTVNMISFSNDLTNAGDNTFIAGYSPHEQTEFIIQFLRDNDISNVMALLPDNAYGKEVARIFEKTIQSQMRQQAQIHFYDPAGVSDEFLDDLSTILEEDPPKAIYIPDSGRKTLTLISKLKFKGLNLQETLVVGSSDWNKPLFTSDHSLKGALFPQTKMAPDNAFMKEYQAAFSTKPNLFAELSYDLIMMIGSLYKSSDTLCFARQEIANDVGFKGTRGRFYFDDNGHIHRDYVLMEITGHKLKKIENKQSAESLLVEKYRDLFDSDYDDKTLETTPTTAG